MEKKSTLTESNNRVVAGLREEGEEGIDELLNQARREKTVW